MKERDFGHGILAIWPTGQLVGGEETAGLVIRLQRAFDAGIEKLIVDLSDVPHLNSTGLHRLTEAQARMEKAGRQMVLSGTDARIQNIFVLTKLRAIFTCFDTVGMAVEDLCRVNASP